LTRPSIPSALASRRLAARAGITEHQALHETLVRAAGAGGLARLLAERGAARAAEAARHAARAERRQVACAQRAARHEAPPSAWRAWFDGSARPNPGRCGIGALLLGPAGERIELSRDVGHGNSSEAEYRALIALLEAALAAGAHDLAIHGDSRVVLDDVNAAAGAPALASYRLRAQALLARIDGVRLRWVPRHKNGAADALSQQAGTAATAEDGI